MRRIVPVLHAVVLLTSFQVASAATLTLASYGSTAAAPSGVSNTATLFLGGGSILAGPSYNVPTNGVWYGPLSNSSWVSNNPNDFPGGSAYLPSGTYTFTSTFFDATPGTTSGSITLLAADTTSAYLNGTPLVSAASTSSLSGQCSTSQPNCTTPLTLNLSGFIVGTNVLSFVVQQSGRDATGLDYAATVNTTPVVVTATPEPSGIALLGTGILGIAGIARRRFIR